MKFSKARNDSKDLSFCSIEFVNFFNIIINLNLKEKNRRTLDSRIEISRLLPLLYISFREETSFSFSHSTIFSLPFPFYVPSMSIYIFLISNILEYIFPFSRFPHGHFYSSRPYLTRDLSFQISYLRGYQERTSLHLFDFSVNSIVSPHPSGSPFSPLSAYKSALPPPLSLSL